MTSIVELKVKTVEGGEIAVEAMPTNTVKELKAKLFEKKHCEDPIVRKILQVQVLANGLLVDDDQTLESAGLLHDESEVTVIYSRNEVEAATKGAIHAEGLLQVNIPSSLTEIPAGAFQDLIQVVKVVIPESVTAIGGFAFLGCSSLESIHIPESVTTIGRGAFENCKSLESITIPESVAAIGDVAFQECSSLKSITIPKSVTTIQRGAFQECHCLESIAIPANVRSIEHFAFLNCASLTSITIPASVVSILSFAFGNCSSLESITIPASVLSIGNFAFQNCVSLTSIAIPQSVRTIGRGAFEGCSSLESITIPESLRDAGRSAFDDALQVMIEHVWWSVVIVGQDWIGFHGQSSCQTRRATKRAMKPSWPKVMWPNTRSKKTSFSFLRIVNLKNKQKLANCGCFKCSLSDVPPLSVLFLS